MPGYKPSKPIEDILSDSRQIIFVRGGSQLEFAAMNAAEAIGEKGRIQQLLENESLIHMWQDKLSKAKSLDLCHANNEKTVWTIFNRPEDIGELLRQLNWEKMPAIGAKHRWNLVFHLPNGEKVDLVSYHGDWNLNNTIHIVETFKDVDDRLYNYLEKRYRTITGDKQKRSI